MILKHLSLFNRTLIRTNNYRRQYSDVRKVTIGNVTYEKADNATNPEYVPKKFRKKNTHDYKVNGIDKMIIKNCYF